MNGAVGNVAVFPFPIKNIGRGIVYAVKDSTRTDDWIKDPYMTVVFYDPDTRLPKYNKVSHLYLTRPEYKKIDPRTDLIFTEDMHIVFNLLINRSGIIPDIINSYHVECSQICVDRGCSTYQFAPLDALPDYRELPFIRENGHIINILSGRSWR